MFFFFFLINISNVFFFFYVKIYLKLEFIVSKLMLNSCFNLVYCPFNSKCVINMKHFHAWVKPWASVVIKLADA
jgi:hypothetical protein